MIEHLSSPKGQNMVDVVNIVGERKKNHIVSCAIFASFL